MGCRVIITGRCDSKDYGKIRDKLLELVVDEVDVTLILGGPMTILNEICTNLAGHMGWKIERNESIMHKNTSTRMKDMVEKGADFWLVLGRGTTNSAGGARYWADRHGISLTILS